MAQDLHDKGKVTEIYLANGNIPNSKFLLIIYEDGTLKLEWCYENTVEIQKSPTLVKISRGTLLEYGEPNLLNIRQRLRLKDEQGNLDSMWEKVM